MPSPSQQAFYGRLQMQIGPQRLAPYLAAEAGNLPRALARYYWNIDVCKSLYPSLQALEIGLRNNLDRVIAPLFPIRGYRYIASWLTRSSDVVVHTGGTAAVDAAVAKVLGDKYDRNVLRPITQKTHDDLVSTMSFGFWVAMLESAYDSPGTKGVYLWPDHTAKVFPGAAGTLMTTIRATCSQLRHLRNRVFHHEPVWPKRVDDKTLQQHYDAIMQVLRYLGGVHAATVSGLHGKPAIFDMGVEVPTMLQRLDAVHEAQMAKAETARAEKEARTLARKVRTMADLDTPSAVSAEADARDAEGPS